MSTIVLPTPPLFYVSWGCRRCGHTGGVARTTMPVVDKEASEEHMRALFDALRIKLVKLHSNRQGCIAVPDDFILGRATPADKKMMGTV